MPVALLDDQVEAGPWALDHDAARKASAGLRNILVVADLPSIAPPVAAAGDPEQIPPFAAKDIFPAAIVPGT